MRQDLDNEQKKFERERNRREQLRTDLQSETARAESAEQKLRKRSQGSEGLGMISPTANRPQVTWNEAREDLVRKMTSDHAEGLQRQEIVLKSQFQRDLQTKEAEWEAGKQAALRQLQSSHEGLLRTRAAQWRSAEEPAEPRPQSPGSTRPGQGAAKTGPRNHTPAPRKTDASALRRSDPPEHSDAQPEDETGGIDFTGEASLPRKFGKARVLIEKCYLAWDVTPAEKHSLIESFEGLFSKGKDLAAVSKSIDKYCDRATKQDGPSVCLRASLVGLKAGKVGTAITNLNCPRCSAYGKMKETCFFARYAPGISGDQPSPDMVKLDDRPVRWVIKKRKMRRNDPDEESWQVTLDSGQQHMI
ncbi:uncharacterized protein HMPREF1541_03115 [Cyphellophora europaea CBS 101466]|uniref:Uncharacterized protein n=1 Tax=Cyphellophora europaea (strain CBS 101466) TaxID=1220924 RepID=W2RXX7_CYPE1|nr:uncharacterized protein HMPREF1541_03115 [Cyphellophora europaea CBS 101466]ETN41180.1 hypothetical protein HMPREF1541_03115 [Cyphellophora europaea CBS 101466]